MTQSGHQRNAFHSPSHVELRDLTACHDMMVGPPCWSAYRRDQPEFAFGVRHHLRSRFRDRREAIPALLSAASNPKFPTRSVSVLISAEVSMPARRDLESTMKSAASPSSLSSREASGGPAWLALSLPRAKRYAEHRVPSGGRGRDAHSETAKPSSRTATLAAKVRGRRYSDLAL
jgi:hypothetical protein